MNCLSDAAKSKVVSYWRILRDERLETTVGSGAGTTLGVIRGRGTPVGTDAAAGMKKDVVSPSMLMGRYPPGGWDSSTWMDCGMASAMEEMSSTGAVKMIVRVTYFCGSWRV